MTPTPADRADLLRQAGNLAWRAAKNMSERDAAYSPQDALFVLATVLMNSHLYPECGVSAAAAEAAPADRDWHPAAIADLQLDRDRALGDARRATARAEQAEREHERVCLQLVEQQERGNVAEARAEQAERERDEARRDKQDAIDEMGLAISAAKFDLAAMRAERDAAVGRAGRAEDTLRQIYRAADVITTFVRIPSQSAAETKEPGHG